MSYLRYESVAWRLASLRTTAAAAAAATVVGTVLFAAAPSGSASEPQRSPHEIASLRTATSQTFVQPDGSFRTTIASQPLNYRDARGNWRRIHSELVKSAKPGYRWRNEANAFQVSFKDAARGGLLDLGFRGAEMSLSLDGARRAPVAKTGANGVAYSEALPHVGLEYAVLPAGVKESLVLEQRGVPATYTFRLRVGSGAARLRAIAGADGSVGFYRDSGEPVFSIAAPVVNESLPTRNGSPATGLRKTPPPVIRGGAPASPGEASLGVRRSSAHDFVLTLRVDRAWLNAPGRVFPVVVDPTITAGRPLQDGYYATDATANLPNVSGTELFVGPNGATTYAAPMTFDLTSIPQGAHVTAASVRLNVTSCFGTCPSSPVKHTDLTLKELTSPWTSVTPWSSIAAGSPLATSGFDMGSSALHTGDWVYLQSASLADRVEGWLGGASPNYGLLVQGSTTGVRFGSSRFTNVSRVPRLDVEWVAKGVQLSPPADLHSDGAELAWQPYSGGLGPYPQAVLADSPLGYWRLDDAPDSSFGIADWTGSVLMSGTPFGTLARQEPGGTADGDRSTYFDGSTAYVEIPKSTALDGVADRFTAEAWVKRGTVNTGTYTIMARGDDKTGGGGFRLQVSTVDGLLLGKGNGGPTIAESTSYLPDTRWHHVAATKDGSAVHLYLDGRDVTGAVANQTLSTGKGTLDIGTSPHWTGSAWTNSAWFNGWIDEAAVWPTALTAAQIQAHYAAGLARVAGFREYDVHRSTAPGFTPSPDTLVQRIADPSVSSYRDSTAAPSTTFYYKVVTVTDDGSYISNEIAAALPADGHSREVIQAGLGLSASDATSITSGNTCANEGGMTTLSVDSTTRSLLHFDTRRVPPNADVTAATVSLFTDTPNKGTTVSLYRVKGDWAEGSAITAACDKSGATWAKRTPYVSWKTAGGDFDSATAVTTTEIGGNPHWDSWDVTPIVQGWIDEANPNLGVLLKRGTGSDSIVYASDDSTTSTALRPRLTIDYTDGSHAHPPQVAVGAPGPTTVTGTVDVTAGASDDGRVTSVRFQLDGSDLGAALTSPPYRMAWDTATASRGAHTLTAVATDDAGNAATSSPVTVTVANSGAPTVSITDATATGSSWAVTADAGDDVDVARVEFSVDGSRFATDATAPYAATLDTAALPVYDGAHSVTATAYDDDGNTTVSDPAPIAVANTAGTPYRATISATSMVPAEMAYDPGTGTQAGVPLGVSLRNTSDQTWASSSIKLRYRWLSPDGTEFSNSGDISIGADLPAGGTRAVSTSVQPPVLTASTMRGRFTLRVDLYDASAGGGYFAAKGNPPFEQTVTVTRLQPDELGVASYQEYDREELGGGVHDAVNLANGNNVVQLEPLAEPGRGPDTNLSMTYNSLEVGSASALGNGWSLAVSGVTSLGLPLDVHPNAADTAAGRTAVWVGLADTTGAYQRFTGNASGTYYTAPAGTHLYLRQDSGAPADRRWQLVRPDRTTFFYDADGYPTRIEDADGNALVFTLDTLSAGDDANGLTKRVTAVTDAAGRSFTLAYYSRASAWAPALMGRLRSVTDHVGRRLDFDYYADGNLLRMTEDGGTHADGSYLAARSLVFTYVNPAGSGPAIATLPERRTPDPGTAEGTRLFSVIDYRGNETTFGYATGGATQGRLESRTNRTGDTTTFSYDLATRKTTVAKPLDRTWIFTFDALGRPTEIDEPVPPGGNATQTWNADNELQRVMQPDGQYHIDYTYDANGDMTSKTDQLGDRTTWTYASFPVDSADTGSNWEAGRTIGHVSRLVKVVEPQGNATSSNPTDYTTTYGYAGDDRDHVATITDALGNVTTQTWNPDGTLASKTLPANGDGITRTTTYDGHDENGLATQVTDAAGNVARSTYRADGLVISTQDAYHGSYTAGDASVYRTESFYDSFGDPERTSRPKSTALWPGLLIWDDTGYDANGNAVVDANAHYGAGDMGVAATTTTAYDAMDRPTLVTGPRQAADGGPVQTQTDYDAAGRAVRVTAPNGVETAPVGTKWTTDFVTETTYDRVDRVASTSSYAVANFGDTFDGSAWSPFTRKTSYCYDFYGDLRTVTTARGSFTACPSMDAAPYSGPYTTRYDYDGAHRRIRTTDPAGNATQTAYDANGAVVATTDANGKKTTFGYDDRGERISQVQPFDTNRTLTTKWEYDAIGDLSRSISPQAYDMGASTGTFDDAETYHYDALQRATRVDLADQAGEAVHEYDANGNPTLADLPGSTTSSTYWDTGQIASTATGQTPATHFDYTAEGWQASRIPEVGGSPGTLDYGKAMYWDYLPDGLVRSERDEGGQRTQHTYDADGNELTQVDASGITDASQTAETVQETYDGFDELAKSRSPKPGSTTTWIATVYSYDDEGEQVYTDTHEENAAGTQTAAIRTTQISYDTDGRVAGESDSGGTLVVTTYTPTGQPASRTVGSPQEQRTAYTYYDNGKEKTETVYNASDAMIEQHTLYYGASGANGGGYMDGNKTEDDYKLLGPATGAPCRTTACITVWGYQQGRPYIEITDKGGATVHIHQFVVQPDGAVGNEQDWDTNRTTGGMLNLHYTARLFDGQRLALADTDDGPFTRYIYDADGNLDCAVKESWVSAKCPADGSTALVSDEAYDYEHRLSSSRTYNTAGTLTDSADYVTDPLGRTASEIETHSGSTTTTAFAYNDLTDAVAKETVTGTGATTRTYSQDPVTGKPSAIIAGTTRYSYADDPHGSVSLVVSSAGAVKASYGYAAYGGSDTDLTKVASGFSSSTNPIRYTSDRSDGGSDTIDMGAREYDPDLKAFLQPDGFDDASADFGLSDDTLTSNRYAFAGGNPVNLTDPDGHAPVGDQGDLIPWQFPGSNITLVAGTGVPSFRAPDIKPLVPTIDVMDNWGASLNQDRQRVAQALFGPPPIDLSTATANTCAWAPRSYACAGLRSCFASAEGCLGRIDELTVQELRNYSAIARGVGTGCSDDCLWPKPVRACLVGAVNASVANGFARLALKWSVTLSRFSYAFAASCVLGEFWAYHTGPTTPP